MFVCPECGLAMEQAGHCPQDGTALAPRSDDHLVGTTLGPYRVARLLGVGGMGRVYKGVHPQIGSRVAIKVLSYECAQRKDLVERFFAEARAVNLIRHESIVNVLDLATLPDGRPYIIMEYLDGAPLATIVEQAGPLPLGSLARLVVEALDALGAAHAKGIVHRDLKPDNIYITPAGHPKVLDFGIAKLQENTIGSATQTGSLLGTPHYMSPEQAMGRPVDLRTDIYAIGVILFECATGRRPFHADSLFDLLRKHVDEPPPPPRSLRPDMPAAYEQVILQALAKPPEQRWASTQALAQALQHACAGISAEQWTPITPGNASSLAAQLRTPASWPSGGGWPSAPGATPVPPTSPSGPPAGMTPPPHVGTGSAPTHHYGMVPPAGASPIPGAGGPIATPPGPGAGAMQPGAMGAMTPPVHQGAPSTVTSSAGQVVAPRSGGGGKGLWIGIAAVAVLGGGGAAAYVATQGSSGSSSSSAKSGEPDVTDEELDDLAGVDDEIDLAEPDPENADLAADFEALEKQMEAFEKQAEAQLDQAMRQLDALDPTVPKAMGAAGNGGGGGGGGAPSAAAGYGGGYPSGPVRLELPAGWNPKAFDGSAWLATATEVAKSIWPDAELIRIDAAGVRPNGLSELTLSGDFGKFQVRYWFRSPSASERPADLPIGVKYEAECNAQMFVGEDGITLLPMDWDCDETIVKPPRCTLQQVWDKAIKRGAPGGNAVADMGYRADFKNKPVWYVTVGEWSEIIPDGC